MSYHPNPINANRLRCQSEKLADMGTFNTECTAKKLMKIVFNVQICHFAKGSKHMLVMVIVMITIIQLIVIMMAETAVMGVTDCARIVCVLDSKILDRNL